MPPSLTTTYDGMRLPDKDAAVRQAGGRTLWFYPTIGAAIAAGLPWLTVQRHQTRVTGVLPAMLHLKFPA